MPSHGRLCPLRHGDLKSVKPRSFVANLGILLQTFFCLYIYYASNGAKYNGLFWKKTTICYAFISSNHFFHTPRSLVCLVLTIFWIQCIYCPALTNCKKRHTHTHTYIYIYLFIYLYIYIYILFRIVYGSLSINPMCQVYLH